MKYVTTRFGGSDSSWKTTNVVEEPKLYGSAPYDSTGIWHSSSGIGMPESTAAVQIDRRKPLRKPKLSDVADHDADAVSEK